MKLKRMPRLRENLKDLLLAKNISLHQLSKRTNINKSTLHNYLNGVAPQGLAALLKLTQFFEVSMEELLFEKEVKIAHAKKPSIRIGEGRFEVTIKKVE